MMDDFDPSMGETFTTESPHVVFPDGRELLDEFEKEHGHWPNYRVSRVPKTTVYIMYAVNDERREIHLIKIRTHHAGRN